jgi:hypothetical protein
LGKRGRFEIGSMALQVLSSYYYSNPNLIFPGIFFAPEAQLDKILQNKS